MPDGFKARQAFLNSMYKFLSGYSITLTDLSSLREQTKSPARQLPLNSIPPSMCFLEQVPEFTACNAPKIACAGFPVRASAFEFS